MRLEGKGGKMLEQKIKVKDLVTQIDVPSKEMLRALRELKLPARSTAGSVSMEDAERLRDYFAMRKNEAVERTTVQPNVIVRRRRKDIAPETPQVSPDTGEVPAEMEASGDSTEFPVLETPTEEDVLAPEFAEKSAPPTESPRVPARKPAPAARVISRPGDEKAKVETPPVPEKTERESEKPEREIKKEPRSGKTLAEEIREREAAER